MNVPEAIAHGLNGEQLVAVRAVPDRHYLVLAGAGCGKTTVLTRRIAYLSHCGIDLSKILALTFTRKAAEEMAERLHALAGASKRAGIPTVTTFHAFSLGVLAADIDGKSNFSRAGFYGKPKVCTERERLALVARCSTSADREQLHVDLLHLDALVERLNVFPDFLQCMPVGQAQILQKISQDFKKQKQHEGLWDFSDLIDCTAALFSDDTMVLQHYRQRYDMVLVDEFQDTNPIQIRLINQILGNDKKLFAVGDDDQAIYAFRGADIRPTLSFTHYFPGAAILKLQTNYRSYPAILSKANRIFVDKDPSYRKILVSGKYKGNCGVKPSVRGFGNQELMADWILNKAASISAEKGIAVGEMAALFRINQTAEWMQAYFSSKNIDIEKLPQLLTVHKSKGLEFPVVFLCDMEEGVFPSYRSEKKKCVTFVYLMKWLFSSGKKKNLPDISEEQRLFYVAVTRAQQYLFLLYSKNKQLYGRNRKFDQSRFLKYMA